MRTQFLRCVTLREKYAAIILDFRPVSTLQRDVEGSGAVRHRAPSGAVEGGQQDHRKLAAGVLRTVFSAHGLGCLIWAKRPRKPRKFLMISTPARRFFGGRAASEASRIAGRFLSA